MTKSSTFDKQVYERAAGGEMAVYLSERNGLARANRTKFLSRGDGVTFRYKSRRMVVRIKWALFFSVKPGGTAGVFFSALVPAKKYVAEAKSFFCCLCKKTFKRRKQK